MTDLRLDKGIPTSTSYTSESGKETSTSTKTGGTEKVGSGVSTDRTSSNSPLPTTSDTSTSVSVRTSTNGSPPSDSVASGERISNASPRLTDTLAALDKLITSLRDPNMLASLLIEMSAMQRQNSLDQRVASRETAKAQLEGQAAETIEAAVKELAAAAVSVVMAVVSFAVAFGGAVKMGSEVKQGVQAGKNSMASSEDAATLMQDAKLGKMSGSMSKGEIAEVKKAAKELKIEAEKFDKLSNASFKQADQTNLYTQAINTLVKGLGEGIENTLRATAKFDDAQGQVLAANAQDTEADAETMKAFMDSIDELLKTALQFIQQMNDAEVEMMASASRL